MELNRVNQDFLNKLNDPRFDVPRHRLKFNKPELRVNVTDARQPTSESASATWPRRCKSARGPIFEFNGSPIASTTSWCALKHRTAYLAGLEKIYVRTASRHTVSLATWCR